MSDLHNTGILRRIRMSKARTLVAPSPVVIDDTNLSRAWARLLLQILDNAGRTVAPLILSLCVLPQTAPPFEAPAVRQALDLLLKRKGRKVVETSRSRSSHSGSGDVARRPGPPFRPLSRDIPRWQAMNRKANGRGLYFERMIMYGRGPCDGNQLEWILSQFNSRTGVRRSMLQATTFDPGRRPRRQRATRLSLPAAGKLRTDRGLGSSPTPSTPPSRFMTKLMATISA